MITNESSTSRLEVLSKLINLERNGHLNSQYYEDKIDSLLEGKVTSDQILNESLKDLYSEDIADWKKYIINKPVYNTLIKITRNEIDNPAIIMKAITSLLTQMFIRYEKNNQFPLELFYAYELSKTVSEFIRTKTFNLKSLNYMITKILNCINNPEEVH